MFDSLKRMKISTKLTGLVGSALLALCIMGAIAVFAARTVEGLGHELNIDTSAFDDAELGVQVATERAINAVHSAPAELDLGKLKAAQERFQSLLGESRTQLQTVLKRTSDAGIKASIDKTDTALSAFEQASKKVFDFCASFAQPDAITALSTSVAPAEAAVQAGLKEFHLAVDANSKAKEAVIAASIAKLTAIVIGFAALLVIGIGTFAYLIVIRGVVRPIAATCVAMRALAGGDSNAAVPGLGRHDEIGEMAEALQVFKTNAFEQLRLAEEFQRTVREREERNRSMEGAVESFRNVTSELLATVGSNAATMKETAQALSGVAGGASNQAESAAVASEETANNVQTVAAASEQLASSIHEISRQVTHATEAVRQASATTERSAGEIEGLAAAGQRIGAVVDLIQAIAAQTNLLALNATIEAARAGEAGKGFAVVASEVKNLAGQTAKATEEIAQHVAGIQSSTKSAVTAVKEIAAAMSRIDAVQTSIAGAIEQQGAATKEISSNVQRAADGTQTLSASLTSVSGAIGETSRSADQVLTASDTVSQAAEKLSEEVRKFFVALRTGPMDRRKGDDSSYGGTERRRDRATRSATGPAPSRAA